MNVSAIERKIILTHVRRTYRFEESISKEGENQTNKESNSTEGQLAYIVMDYMIERIHFLVVETTYSMDW